MNLQGIVSVSGKPGLWRALAQNKTGYVLESLDANKTKLVANLSTAKLAALNEITIFGDSDDIKLTDVFERIKGAAKIPDVKADGKLLRNFFREVAPEHDEEKVYASDIKKVISWYQILKVLPLFEEEDPAKPAPEADPVVEEAATPADEEQPVAKKKKKTAEKLVEPVEPEPAPVNSKSKKTAAKKG